MGSQKRSSIPLYLRIYEALRARIRAGELKVGDPVDPQRALAKRFKVSVMTVRQALDQLEHEGLVATRHGAGTVVSAPPVIWNRLMSHTERMEGLGLRPGSKLLAAGVVAASPAESEQLQLRAGAKLVRIERLRLADGQPMAVETARLAFSEFHGLLNYKLEEISLMATLADSYRVPITHTEETIEARGADQHVAGLLKVRLRTPLIHLAQVLFTTRHRPVMLSSGWYRADLHSFRIARVRV